MKRFLKRPIQNRVFNKVKRVIEHAYIALCDFSLTFQSLGQFSDDRQAAKWFAGYAIRNNQSPIGHRASRVAAHICQISESEITSQLGTKDIAGIVHASPAYKRDELILTAAEMGGSKLIRCALWGDSDSANYLCCSISDTARDDFILKNQKNGATALSFAAQDGCIDIIKVLLGALSDDCRELAVLHADQLGYTPLLLAAYGGHFETVRLLCAALSNDNRDNAIKWADRAGDTPLLGCVRYNDLNITQLLLENLSANARNIAILNSYAEGKIPLFEAAQMGHVNLFKLLFDVLSNEAKNQAFIYLNHEGKSILTISALNGYVEIVEFICNRYKSSDSPNLSLRFKNDMKVAFYLAAKLGHETVVTYLLALVPQDQMEQFILSSTTDTRDTALVLSACNGHLNIVKIILDALSETQKIQQAIQHRANDGMTALMTAAKEGQNEIVVYLLSLIFSLKLGTQSILAQDNDRKTALDYIAIHCDEAILDNCLKMPEIQKYLLNLKYSTKLIENVIAASKKSRAIHLAQGLTRIGLDLNLIEVIQPLFAEHRAEMTASLPWFSVIQEHAKLPSHLIEIVFSFNPSNSDILTPQCSQALLQQYRHSKWPRENSSYTLFYDSPSKSESEEQKSLAPKRASLS